MNIRKKWAALGLGGFCLCLIGFYLIQGKDRTKNSDVTIDERATYTVSGLVDGDTFKAKIGSRSITVRMLGINTPETVDPRKPVECFGHEASQETSLLLSGHSVRLVGSPGRERRDKYGRYLLYVYRDDGLFVNEELLRLGFAREYTIGSAYSMQKEFRAKEAEAKQAKRGLWGVCAPT